MVILTNGFGAWGGLYVPIYMLTRSISMIGPFLGQTVEILRIFRYCMEIHLEEQRVDERRRGI